MKSKRETKWKENPQSSFQGFKNKKKTRILKIVDDKQSSKEIMK